MRKGPRYTLLTVSSVVLLGLAIATVLPSPNSKPDLLGYRTLCAFVPVSTAILLGVAGFLRILRDTLTDTQAPAANSLIESGERVTRGGDANPQGRDGKARGSSDGEIVFYLDQPSVETNVLIEGSGE